MQLATTQCEYTYKVVDDDDGGVFIKFDADGDGDDDVDKDDVDDQLMRVDDLDQLQVFGLGDKVSPNPGRVEEPLSVGLVEHLAYQVTLL